MKKKTMLILSYILVAFFAIASGVTFAWITQEGKLDEFQYNVGEIKYSIVKEGGISSGTVIVPGDDLGTVTITNNSNIKTNLRIQITVTATKEGSSQIWTVGVDDPENSSDQILITKDSNWIVSDGYLYYKSATDSEGVIAPKDPVDAPYSKMYLNGKVVINDHQNTNLKFNIKFQAKQADHVTWQDLGTITWSKGI